MNWPDNNGDRKNILALAKEAFANKKNAINASITSQIVNQIRPIWKAMGLDIYGHAGIEKYNAEKGLDKVQEAVEQQKEMAAIKAKAQANGTFMLAPNGKKSNLTERQWLQVRTKNFKKWFGDWENDPKNASKIVDENGEPLVVYHQGAPDKRIFRGDSFGLSYFGDSLTSATYGGSEYGIFLNVRNPIIVEGNNEEIGDITEKLYGTRRISPQENQDGVIYKHVKDVGEGIYEWDYDEVDTFWAQYEQQGYGTVYAVSNPNQIKSATDNNGDFSTENDDIQMAIDTNYVTASISDDEKDEIYIQLKKINRAKRTLIDTGQGFYLTDHTDAEGLYRDDITGEPKGFQVK